MLFKLGRKVSEAGGTGAADHRRVLIAKLNELLSQLLLLWSGFLIAGLEEGAAADSAHKEFVLSKLDDHWGEDVLDVCI